MAIELAKLALICDIAVTLSAHSALARITPAAGDSKTTPGTVRVTADKQPQALRVMAPTEDELTDDPAGRFGGHVDVGLAHFSRGHLDFTMSPAHLQTNCFRALCAVASLLLLWALYGLRLRYVTRTLKMTLEARVNERARIAGELHDTLLQSLHGVMFQLQAVRNQLPRRPHEAMRSLDLAISDTERALAESRDAIQGLRSEPIAKGTLAEFLMASSRELTAFGTTGQQPPVFELLEEGEKRALSSAAKNEIYRVAQEILRNAYRHAQATRIEAETRYDDRGLRVRIRDNGRGIDSTVLKQGGVAGHWGLRGVRERSERIGARLDFWSEAGAGTEVQLTVPAGVAYQTAPNDVRPATVAS